MIEIYGDFKFKTLWSPWFIQINISAVRVHGSQKSDDCGIYRPLRIKRVYLLLYKVADTPFHIKGVAVADPGTDRLGGGADFVVQEFIHTMYMWGCEGVRR